MHVSFPFLFTDSTTISPMKLTPKEYISGLFVLPAQTARAFLHYGFRGIYLGVCVYLFRGVPFALKFPPFGKIGTYHEFLNIFDNFIEGELRNAAMENEIRKSENPVIVDLGINLGATVRWWFWLNPKAKVYGIDMIPESLEFTTARLATIQGKFSWHGIPAAISDKTEEFDIQYDDPLEGSNSVFSSEGKIKRTVKADTLDNLIRPHSLSSVEVLKIDIEGYGAIALRKADELLSITKYIILETHTEEEISEANQILAAKGWELFVVKGRTAFYRNPSILAK